MVLLLMGNVIFASIQKLVDTIKKNDLKTAHVSRTMTTVNASSNDVHEASLID